MNHTFLFWLTGSSDVKLQENLMQIQTESRSGLEKK